MADPMGIPELERRLRELEQQIDASERRAQEAGTRLQQEQNTRRPTTLNEYLTACHDCLFSSLKVEPDPRLQTKGTLPNPRKKWCPTTLKPWSGMIEARRQVLGNVYGHFPADLRVFESRVALAAIGTRLAMRSVADEKRLETFMHLSVEDPVRSIIDELNKVEAVRAIFPLGDGIVFENHVHALSDGSDELVDAEQRLLSSLPSTPGRGLDKNQLRPDQICVFRSDDASRTMVYVSEYKPPHKLTTAHISLSLRGPLDIYADVVNRKTVPTDADSEAKFLYDAERLTASAITQTYHYMIEGGLEYGLLTTGEMIIFLCIDWSDPSTLLFHKANPGAEVEAHPANAPVCTAVGQYLAFSIMALESSVHDQEERLRATANLRTWAEDFETTYRSIPPDRRRAPDSSPGFEPVAYRGVDRSPYLLRRGKRRYVVPDGPARELRNQDPREPPDDDDAAPDTPSPAERRRARPGAVIRRSQPTQTQASQGRGGGQARKNADYCTQKCLLGLVRGGFLDPHCPNVSLHGAHDGRRHPIDHACFQDLLWKQLEQSLDDGITPLPEGGARGVLFRVTLLAHGYTFIAKGTVRAFIKHLEHEAAVYRHLRVSQGVHVPVLLGAIDLRSMNKTYYFAHRVYIVHMTFLSWGGRGICLRDLGDGDITELEGKALRSLRAVNEAGVFHRDVRLPNMLLNAEVGGVVLIDFERATIVQEPRQPLAPLSPTKRKRGLEAAPDDGKARGERPVAAPFSEDLSRVGLAFDQRCIF